MLQNITKFFSSNWTYIKTAFFSIIVGGILCYFIMIYLPKDPQVVTDWQAQYALTQHKLDSAAISGDNLRKQIDSLQQKGTVISKEEKQLDLKIPVINKQKDEEISVINSYGVDSLQQFFANRYDTSQNK